MAQSIALQILILIIAVAGFVLYLAYRKYREYGIKILGMIPIINTYYFKSKVKKEVKLAESGTKYLSLGEDDPDGKKFQAFLMKLPKYHIEDGFLASNIRALMKAAGAEYKQIVLINKSDVSDKKLWVRKAGQFFIHEKGTYFIPWECMKDIFYWDIIDSRPLIDKTEDINWYNPEMCAEVVTSVTNTNDMKNLSEDSLSQLSQTIKLLMIISVIGVIVAAIGAYMSYKNTEITAQVIELLKR